MNSLTPKTPETIYYTAVSAKLLKSYFSTWPTAAILDFCQLRLMPTLLRATPPLVSFIDKNTKKRTFALHGHGSAPDDPTNSYPGVKTRIVSYPPGKTGVSITTPGGKFWLAKTYPSQPKITSSQQVFSLRTFAPFRNTIIVDQIVV